MILVTGATGNIGSHLVATLLDQDAPVRVLVRDANKARAAFGDSVDIVSGDLRDASSVSAALTGAERVFLNSPSPEGFFDLQRPLIDAAEAAGVEQLVRLSVLGAAPDATTSFGRGHFSLDEHLKASALSWTILQPNGFMQNLLSSAETIKAGAIYASAGDGHVSMIDARDIAEVAAAVLTTGGHTGESLVLTGSEAFTYGDAAAAFAAELGHDVHYVDTPPEVTRKNLLGFGLPAGQVEDILALFEIFRAGYASTVTPTVANVLGRAPRSLTTFVHDYRGAFTDHA
ncbi:MULTISPECIES: SDR family oxidoreductase [unclassified Cryobacterium]|uniref:SDR family oxidoreductase n=1 Tax=unclassified Cryobacterium TaxID=2649013 RepID=UPI002AB43331|nr:MULTISPECIES: SDR family oxidoreductase [unclassified Cryobacterium]MDY7543997.1 SDR family oxidoreductase [Cryobacterium sp. 5B3]MEA9997727.1 SDR family oxidoreductase [Cryobacterium sp. RTS3]MEB0265832.1 SDR family oxidoreductase [Cryobacterium sp. 10I5]MEB0273184.1 SDR family oxidoreductase [Cryobacterium sp. 5B3]